MGVLVRVRVRGWRVGGMGYGVRVVHHAPP